MAAITRRITRRTLAGLITVLEALRKVSMRQILPRARVVRGMRLVTHPSDDGLYERAAAAFSVIQEHAPDDWAKLCDSGDIVMVAPLAGDMRGRFIRESRLYQLDTRFVKASEPGRIAQQLVHEARHAWGPAIDSRSDRAGALAVERACVEAEIVFATRLPGAGHLASEASTRLLTVDRDYSRDHEAVRQAPAWMNRLVWRLLE